MSASTSDTLFPIRELVRRTGVNASTLRAWESRHGLINPTRTASGHRLYSDKDVARVRELRELLDQGLGLAEIGPLLERVVASKSAEPAQITGWRAYLRATVEAIEAFDPGRLDNLYNEACALYPIEVVTTNLLIPVLDELGERWDIRPSGIAEEHFFSAWLRNKLGARLHHVLARHAGRPLILACLPGEGHELGLLVFALGLLDSGRRVIYLGANMPLRQILHVARSAHALGIVLAGRAPLRAGPLFEDIAWLAREANVPLFAGGQFSVIAAVDLVRVGGIPLGDDIERGLAILDARLTGARPVSSV
jgi:DNA-binding transcriptional MerR regulator/methylmalonyl-CoA mutase cobalamin-binding subunit